MADKPFSHNQPNKSQPSVMNAPQGMFTHWPVIELDELTLGFNKKPLIEDVRHAVSVYGHILERNYWYSFTEFAHEIMRHYDMSNPQNHWAMQAIKLSAQRTEHGKSLYPKFFITPDNKPVSIKTMAAGLRRIRRDPDRDYTGWNWFPTNGWAILASVRKGIHDRINRRGHAIIE